MKYISKMLFLSLIFFYSSFAQKITGLSDWNIYLDPGHSQEENKGIYNYSEAHKVLRVGLALRDMLLNETDIDTVYICRTNDQVIVSLAQRTDQANQLGAAWYHSIHSDAGSPGANSTLLLWGQNKDYSEKVPNGGKAMSDIMVGYLTRALRTNTRGSVGDYSYYYPTNTAPYLHVNRESSMPSELSEAGFHTNPVQNTLNMNADWKKLEARTMFWAILDYKGIPRPKVGICTGIIKDKETSVPINGAKITIGGKSYTTDSYQSLFKPYSQDSTQLHNGFYYFEGLQNDSLSYTVEAPGYIKYTSKVFVVDSFFTFNDVALVNALPPSAAVQVADSVYPGKEVITVIFSRPMNKQSVENNISCSPGAGLLFSWADIDRKLTIRTDSLKTSTHYTFTISGNAKDNYDNLFDGNKDGIGGDSLSFSFVTKAQDTYAPEIANSYPAPDSANVELLPVISIQFDELINSSTAQGKVKLQRAADQSFVDGITNLYDVKDKTVINFFPGSQLKPGEDYRIIISSGISDLYGNAVSTDKIIGFRTGVTAYTVTIVDNFETSISASNWYQPQQSGSTTGIITNSTSMAASSTYTDPFSTGTTSMRMNYGWDTAAKSWLIREYLNTGSPKNVMFNSSYLVQVYIFGDGSGNKFRFCVDDALGHEVGPWIDIDWRGWKLVTWDLANDPLGTWIGNGKLDGTLNIESLHFTYTSGSPITGTVYLDDLRIAKKVTVGVEKDNNQVPDKFVLNQNYPNPFNPSTIINYQLPKNGNVTLKVYDVLGKEVSVLVNSFQPAGNYKVTFNANNLTSGIYIYKITADGFSEVRKMMLLK